MHFIRSKTHMKLVLNRKEEKTTWHSLVESRREKKTTVHWTSKRHIIRWFSHTAYYMVYIIRILTWKDQFQFKTLLSSNQLKNEGNLTNRSVDFMQTFLSSNRFVAAKTTLKRLRFSSKNHFIRMQTISHGLSNGLCAEKRIETISNVNCTLALLMA